jgi:hypothetical protein
MTSYSSEKEFIASEIESYESALNLYKELLTYAENYIQEDLHGTKEKVIEGLRYGNKLLVKRQKVLKDKL